MRSPVYFLFLLIAKELQVNDGKKWAMRSPVFGIFSGGQAELSSAGHAGGLSYKVMVQRGCKEMMVRKTGEQE